MPTALPRPRCAILAVKDRDADTITIAYDYGAWTRSCSAPSVTSLLLYTEMRPLLGLKPEWKCWIEARGSDGVLILICYAALLCCSAYS